MTDGNLQPNRTKISLSFKNVVSHSIPLEKAATEDVEAPGLFRKYSVTAKMPLRAVALARRDGRSDLSPKRSPDELGTTHIRDCTSVVLSSSVGKAPLVVRLLFKDVSFRLLVGALEPPSNDSDILNCDIRLLGVKHKVYSNFTGYFTSRGSRDCRAKF
uniref:Uncharacterized protein n=1 Tax=Romanomermis culicivorax TaxID=13658 RepID=A0A915HU33_ROMCU